MKTARFISLMIGLGALMQTVSFAEPSTQAAPKAPAQKAETDETRSVKREKEHETHGKTDAPANGHSGERPENHKVTSQVSRPPVNKTEEKHSTMESPKAREANMRRPGATLHGPNAIHNSGHTSKAAGNIPNKVTPGNAFAQHPAGTSKSAFKPNSAVTTRKTGNTSTHPAAFSANKLPTSSTVNTGRGRLPAQATIGGPTKPGMANTAAISGTGIKSRP